MDTYIQERVYELDAKMKEEYPIAKNYALGFSSMESGKVIDIYNITITNLEAPFKNVVFASSDMTDQEIVDYAIHLIETQEI